MSRRTWAMAAVMGTVLVALPLRPVTAEDLLQEAHRAATTLRFGATVAVEWLDTAGVHRAVATVHSDQGSVSVGGLRWSSAVLLQPPAVDAKYELRTRSGPTVAGRPTVEVDAYVDERLRERLALDQQTHLVLERVQLDGTGHVARRVRIESLSLLPPDDVAVPATPAAVGLPSRYRAPASLASGYERLAAYRRGAVAQAVYGDGLHSLSVFMQPGRLDLRSLPAGVMWVALGRRTGAVHTWPGGVTVTWDVAGVVYTVVGDGPVDDVVAASAAVPPPKAPSWAGEVRRRAKAVAETLLGSSA